MERMTRRAGVLVGTVLLLAAPASAAEDPGVPASGPCDACLAVCELPLSHDDSVLDDSTDSYLLAETREVSKAAAVAMAVELRDLSLESRAGHFGQVYEANAKAIESLAAKPPDQHASSAEIRALKSVRGALFADTILGLAAAADASTSPEFLATYTSRKAVLDGVIRNMSARQPMRAAERLAVCEVLAAYRASQAGSEARSGTGSH